MHSPVPRWTELSTVPRSMLSPIYAISVGLARLLRLFTLISDLAVPSAAYLQDQATSSFALQRLRLRTENAGLGKRRLSGRGFASGHRYRRLDHSCCTLLGRAFVVKERVVPVGAGGG